MSLDIIKIFKHTIDQGFTQSEIDTWDTCAYKWYLRYNLGLLPRNEDTNVPFMFGTAWHDVMKQMYSTEGREWEVPTLKFPKGSQPTTEEEESLEKWQVMLCYMLDAYAVHYIDDFKLFKFTDAGEEIEKLLDTIIIFEGTKIRLKGVIDLMPEIAGRPTIMDHKSAAALNFGVVSGWDFKFQFLFYAWLADKFFPKRFKRITVNGIKKPQIRPKKDEALVHFGLRVRNDMLQEPDKYFYRNTIPIVKGTMERFEDEILRPKLHRIKLISNPKTDQETLRLVTHNKNTNACFNYGYCCPYYNICTNSLSSEIHNYEKSTIKHPHHEQAE